MRGGEPHDTELVRRFAGGSTVDDGVPTLAQIRGYIDSRRSEMLQHLAALAESDLATKPNEKAPWPYLEWFQVLAWHEAQAGNPRVTSAAQEACSIPSAVCRAGAPGGPSPSPRRSRSLASTLAPVR